MKVKGFFGKRASVRHDERGMSLVEMMIVIALMGILSVSAVSLMGRIYYANTKQTVETISSALDKLRINTMSREGNQYLYIYELDGSCYLTESDVKYDSFDSAAMTADGTKLCGGSTEILIDSETGAKVGPGGIIRIAYKKGGAFSDDTNVSKIIIKGKGVTVISLTKDTGKHYIE